jgi:tRNA A37 threonylcarbamoyladenosine dehydratase
MEVKTACAFAAGAALGCAAAYLASRAVVVSSPAPLAPPVAAHGQPLAGDRPPEAAACGVSLDDEVVGEQLTRNVQFFGRDGQQRVCDSFVVVVGLGVRRRGASPLPPPPPRHCRTAQVSLSTPCSLPLLFALLFARSQGVGSHAAHMLLRGGVGKLRLIDFDLVTLSSLNRHAVATRADVGTPKAVALARHFQAISPETHLDVRVSMFDATTAAELLSGAPSCVVDAIDNIDTKVTLLHACHAAGIPVLCVAGAGGKADPTRLHIGGLSDSVRDPLARAVRHKLRRLHGRGLDVPVLFSSEPPRCGLVDPDLSPSVPGGQQLTPVDLQLVPGFRVRTIPVLGTSPALFGCAAAAWALCHLAGQPIHGALPLNLPAEQVGQQLERLVERECLLHGGDGGVEVDPQDVAYLLADLWACRSARQDAEAGRHDPLRPYKATFRATQQLVLTRWDGALPARVDNLVLLTFDEADAHDAEPGGVGGVRVREPLFAASVDSALARARRDHGLDATIR